jgi:anti-anti-sigma factor
VEGHVVVLVKGEVDLATSDQFHDALVAVRRSRHVVVDLRDVTFMNSSGIRAIVRAYNRMPEGGSIRVFGAQPILRQAFEVSGLGGLLVDLGADGPLLGAGPPTPIETEAE